MRALVSGSSGFIGSALVDVLRQSGDEVHRIVRGQPSAGDVGIDLDARALDLSAVSGEGLGSFDVIFHLIGEPLTPRRWGPSKREAIRSSRITTTNIIARAIAASEQRPTTLVVMSAIGFYGNRGDEALDESSGGGSGFLAEVCHFWETAAAPARASGVRVVHARSGPVLGPNGGIMKAVSPIFRLGLGGRLGSGRQWLSWISLADEVAALRFVAETPSISGPCNFTAPNPVTNAEFTATLARQLSRPAVLPVPGLLLRLAVGRTTASDFVLASQRVMASNLTDHGFGFRHPELAGAIAFSLGGGQPG